MADLFIDLVYLGFESFFAFGVEGLEFFLVVSSQFTSALNIRIVGPFGRPC